MHIPVILWAHGGKQGSGTAIGNKRELLDMIFSLTEKSKATMTKHKLLSNSYNFSLYFSVFNINKNIKIVKSLLLFLFLLIFWKSPGQLSCKNVPHLDLSNLFHVIRFILTKFGKNTT